MNPSNLIPRVLGTGSDADTKLDTLIANVSNLAHLCDVALTQLPLRVQMNVASLNEHLIALDISDSYQVGNSDDAVARLIGTEMDAVTNLDMLLGRAMVLLNALRSIVGRLSLPDDVQQAMATLHAQFKALGVPVDYREHTSWL